MADDLFTDTADPGAAGDEPAGAAAQPIVAEYLHAVQVIRAAGAGVPETSYYPALSNLFNAVGQALKPKVRCIINLANRGAGLPDGGLFTADQFPRPAAPGSPSIPGIPALGAPATSGASGGAAAEPRPGQLPARGAIEAKGAQPDVRAIAATAQVRGYLNTYGIVIVTNLRDFLIVERGPTGQVVEREAFALAADEPDFWLHVAAHPRAAAQRLGAPFVEFLQRACLHAAPLTNPKDVAWFLASYARDALYRVERQAQLPALQTVRAALEEALGMKFTAGKGEHFFRSTLVQTLFYGVFSAWVRWHRDNPAANARFDWRTAEWSLHVPFIRTLYRQVAEPNQLGQLGLVEVLDWAAGVLNRVDRGAFFRGFEDQHAVQYFYEPFLEAYDPELRKALGVWYTPPEIVQYQVARVDTVLREELDLPDGLADPNVIVLDPCCGTAAYLVEVLRVIAATLRDKGGEALVASDLKQAAMERVFGFEIMPAPFVVAHLQLGLMLQAQGAPLSQPRGERVGVYLTNALTGWDPPKDPKAQLPLFPDLAEERDAAAHVKRDRKILVVLGNPPYNAFAGVSPDEEQGLVEPYKQGLNQPASAGGWGIKKFNLDDLYVRFFRLAERRIAEMSGQGVVSFISNFSYLGDPSFVVLRQRFLAEFDKLWLDCMNGDSRETGKLTPDGRPDPSVFSTETNREGIRVGTAVCVIVRKAARQKKPTVRFRHFWGASKRADLLKSLTARRFNAAYRVAAPAPHNRLAFVPENVTAAYHAWPRLTELCAVAPFNGPVERRGNSLIRFPSDRAGFAVLAAYLDPDLDDHAVRAAEPRFMFSSGEFRARDARAALKGKVRYDPRAIVRYPFKPFDVRLAYLDAAIQPLFSRPSPQLLSQRFAGNAFFISRDTADRAPEGPPFFFSRCVCDYDSISGHARHFPVRVKNGSRLEKQAEATLFAALGEKPEADQPVANLSSAARDYLGRLKIKHPDDARTAGLIWLHALAIGYSPAYLLENADGIRRDWPRIPLPGTHKALEASAALGARVAALLDTEADVPGVTAGKIAPAFKAIAVPAKVGGGGLDPNSADFAVTAGWGHFGQQRVVMPAKGRLIERPYTPEEAQALDAEAAARGMAAADARRLLGAGTCDVYLNAVAYWRNVPLHVWQCPIGGYQVLKKWLSYRESGVLGRALAPDEVREAMNMARRLAALLLLQPALDKNYHQVQAAAFAWAGA